MDDAEIVASVVVGDPAGLAQAYDRYADSLYAYCWFMLDDPAGAAEAVQGTFLAADSRLGRLRDPERLQLWLYAVARNECLGQFSARPGISALGPSVFGPSPADRLFPAEREVIELQYGHGLKPAEVAMVLGVPHNRAHALLSRAHDQLRASFGGSPGLTPAAALAAMVAASTPGAGSAPAALRNQVLEITAGREDDLLPYRAGGQSPVEAFRRDGYPKPLPMSRTGRPRLPSARTALATGVVAAVVAAVFTFTLVGFRQHPLAAAQPTAGDRPAPASTRSPVTDLPTPTPTPHASRTKKPQSPKAPALAATHRTASPSATPSGSQLPAPAPSPTVSPAPSSPPPFSSPAPGTLAVSTEVLDLSPSQPSGTITLTAQGGPVTWSISQPGELAVSPAEGSLAEGQSVQVTVTAESATAFSADLTVSPGGQTVTVVYRGNRPG